MRDQSFTSAIEAGRTAFSIWEIFDGWHLAAAAKARPDSPAARRSSRSWAASRCRAACALDEDAGIAMKVSPSPQGTGADCR
jgi:hypothetical protein